MTPQLHKFWKRSGFVPVYLRQTANELTGEHTSVMLKVLRNKNDAWLHEFAKDFHKRLLHLLSYEFRKFTAVQALSLIESAELGESYNFKPKPFTRDELDAILSPFDLKRLDSYANNMLDYHVILDMLPLLASLYFTKRTDSKVSLSSVQAAILLAIGLQHKNMDDVSKELNLPVSQSMAMFSKIVRKFSTYFRELLSRDIEKSMPALEDDEMRELNGEEPINAYDAEAAEEALNADLNEAGEEAVSELRTKQRELINALDLKKYAISDDVKEWDDQAAERAAKGDGVLSVKSNRQKRKGESSEKILESEMKSKSKKSKKRK